jgi:hypothetical protein
MGRRGSDEGQGTLAIRCNKFLVYDYAEDFIVSRLETNGALIAILEILKQEAEYLHRQHGWLIAVAETIEKHPEFASLLKEHPFYDPTPRPSLNKITVLTQQIDALVQQLKQK